MLPGMATPKVMTRLSDPLRCPRVVSYRACKRNEKRTCPKDQGGVWLYYFQTTLEYLTRVELVYVRYFCTVCSFPGPYTK